MPSSLMQPVTQKRLTNVAIVRLKTHGKRFEIAAYKNKVQNWREGIEKDINEVLQVVSVFTNVSRGEVAKDTDLKKAFNVTDQEEICRKILKSGDLQVSDRERESQLESQFRDIVQIIVERCVHPQTGRQLTPMCVENALKTTGFSVNPDHVAKRQALKAIESLCAELPDSFSRANMRLRINCPEKLRDAIRKHLKEQVEARIEEDIAAAEGSHASFTFVCGPSHYRDLDSLCTVTNVGEEVTLQIVEATVLGEVREARGDASAPAPAIAATAMPLAPQPPFAGAAVGTGAAAAGGYPQQPPRQSASSAVVAGQPAPGVVQPKKGMKCSACSAEFEDAGEYRQHCRSEWHNFNLKRKVKSLPPVSEEEFAEISLDAKEGFLAVDS
mmetsp:Transcript_107889/g.344359  ORF Transcript_107889/g.344359 Transcript_107889/m.344359 type:complete len:385 (+) Transcript_107889:121-1275(+)|eukprot:CAMPEP_0203871230 /NCGR_PEP_ID=MMETSP0359-20131031/18632_1 /ASSEMBLY_ACC=CAM_ASM_000338 /TAXON_ID=268821 /ORGANISM="Scrippsiella Hangoei, Strain SHTV-5" /LENGTH=384 /DNA_ID=CAMNT_0050789903 /DNA_START=120 /DNA_END=1274 /DNA_ORIENTATION=+